MKEALFFGGGKISHLPFLVSGNFESSFYPRPPVRMLQPHMLMNEPIASRSHFSIQFDEEREKFQAVKTGKRHGFITWSVFTWITEGFGGKGSPGDDGGFGNSLSPGVVFFWGKFQTLIGIWGSLNPTFFSKKAKNLARLDPSIICCSKNVWGFGLDIVPSGQNRWHTHTYQIVKGPISFRYVLPRSGPRIIRNPPSEMTSINHTKNS